MYESELETAKSAALKAGEIALSFCLSNAEVELKSDAENSPVTQADKQIDVYLQHTLISKFPLYGWLSEEIEDDTSRLEKEKVWIVDPIDGTRGYLHWLESGCQECPEQKQFCISIGLVEKGEPVVGVIYAPLTEQLFYAAKGQGAYLNHKKLQVQKTSKALNKATYLASVSETHDGFLDDIKKQVGRFVPYTSIAYKLALTAAEVGDMTASVKPKNEWDVVAGDLICREAGVKVTDLQGKLTTYNNKDSHVHGFIAAPEPLYGQLKSILPDKPFPGY